MSNCYMFAPGSCCTTLDPPAPDCEPVNSWCDEFTNTFPWGQLKSGYLGADHLDTESPAIFSLRTVTNTLQCKPDNASGTLYRCVYPVPSGTYECGRRFSVHSRPYWDLTAGDDIGVFVGGVAAFVYNRIENAFYWVPVDDSGRPNGERTHLLDGEWYHPQQGGAWRFTMEIREAGTGLDAVFLLTSGGYSQLIGTVPDAVGDVPEFFRAGVYCRNGGEWDDLGINQLCPVGGCLVYYVDGFELDPDERPFTSCLSRLPSTGGAEYTDTLIYKKSLGSGPCRPEHACTVYRRYPYSSGVTRLNIVDEETDIGDGQTPFGTVAIYGTNYYPPMYVGPGQFETNYTLRDYNNNFYVGQTWGGQAPNAPAIWGYIGGLLPNLLLELGYQTTESGNQSRFGRYNQLVPYIGPSDAFDDPLLPVVLTKAARINESDFHPPGFGLNPIPDAVYDALPATITAYSGIASDC